MKVFVSAVTAEFGGYRLRLRDALWSQANQVVVQDDFVDSGRDTLQKLFGIVRDCDVVLHLVGRGAGATASDSSIKDFLGYKLYDDPNPEDVASRFAEFAKRLHLSESARLSYTQWEAVFALYLGKPIHVFVARQEITDGHKTANPAFTPLSGDSESVRTHLEWLKEKASRYDEGFCDFESLVVIVNKVLIAAVIAENQELKYKDTYRREQQAEAARAEVAKRRFGTIAPPRLKSWIHRHHKIATPAYLTQVNALMNKGVVTWNADDLPDGWLVEEYIADRCIDWIFDQNDDLIFPAFLWLLRQRAVALAVDTAAAELDLILREAMQHVLFQQSEVEAYCQQWSHIDSRDAASGVLQIKPSIKQDAFQWCFRFPNVIAIASDFEVNVAPEDAVEEARNLIATSTWMNSVGCRRIEVFTELEGMNRPWERKSNHDMHPVPVTVRPPRRPTDWEGIRGIHDRISKNHLPCCGQCVGSSPYTMIEQVKSIGLFIDIPSAQSVPSFRELVCHASMGIWWRLPFMEPDEATELLADLDDEFTLEELPALIHEKRLKGRPAAWRECVVMCSTRDTEFPRPRKNHQLHLAQQ